MKQSKKAYIATLKEQLQHEWCGTGIARRMCCLCKGNTCKDDVCVDCIRNLINNLNEK